MHSHSFCLCFHQLLLSGTVSGLSSLLCSDSSNLQQMHLSDTSLMPISTMQSNHPLSSITNWYQIGYCDPADGLCKYTNFSCGPSNKCYDVYCDVTEGRCKADPKVTCPTGVPTFSTVELTSGLKDKCTYSYCNPSSGECSYSPLSCGTSNKCQTVYCDPALGCRVNYTDCNDNNWCTIDTWYIPSLRSLLTWN